MKQQKLHRPRVPWWSWDYGWDLPPDKGINKLLGNRRARRRGNLDVRRELNDINSHD